VPLLSIVVFAPLVGALVLMLLPGRARVPIRVVSLLASAVTLAGSLVATSLFMGGVAMRETLALVPDVGIC
jgi:NADH:ubiquinone oxidoreductase subunit 4 (subunit M)